MENGRVAEAAIERMLGWIGLRLIRLAIWAAEQLHGGNRRADVPARAALGFVAAVGWAVDRLPGLAPLKGARQAAGRMRGDAGRPEGVKSAAWPT